MTSSHESSKRLLFPLVNALVFMMLFGVIGYYLLDLTRWLLAGMVTGLGIGLVVEFGLGLIGGWIYRRRVLLSALLEVVLVIAFVGPFAYFYMNTTPKQHTVCCIEGSGLGDAVEAVRIPVANGETLAGWYAPPVDGSGAVVMVLHGNGGDRTGSLAHARVLHEEGFGVLVYDQRASGESTGHQRSIGLYDQRDITPIIDWLAARPEVDEQRIGGVGLSLGAHILLGAAPDELRLKALWADGLGVNNGDDLPPSDSPSDVLINFISRQAYWMAEAYLDEQLIPCKQLIPQVAPRPLMLVAGGQDPFEGEFNRAYEPYLGEHGELWIIDNAGHTAGLRTEPELYPARMIDFFDKALRQ
ncbi:MAG TPA: CocE/NonD family hydrolase [Aggregatilinea sp.]|uniref:alpha/beta hydrolase n=1 Tax=Aggregatilinea sp. TaxID=2806333 RepID=UPI002CC98C0A|nr:CocE/NonD family hydrolase [Aggregatilinea sp.]HML23765.1 CocE/NonD family hydrolase [Aggregatilinea sp.]